MDKRNKESIEKDFNILKRFVTAHCHYQHDTEKEEICAECEELIQYAKEKLENCPYNPKPKCKDCKTHCYKDIYQKKVREAMSLAGAQIFKNNLDL